MRRFSHRRGQFGGYDSGMEMMAPTPQPQQRPNQLDPKDERLLELSVAVGALEASNDLITEDNGRLEDENAKLREENKDLRARNTSLEQSTYRKKGASDLVDEIKEELKTRKVAK